VSFGAERIFRERERQQSQWSPGHDDRHDASELALAASYLALPNNEKKRPPDTPQWAYELRTNDRLRELEVAGALIAAEIDRLLRKL